MHTISVKAPAKLNISLDITGTSDDGYHLLSTIMQSVNIYDVITITRTNSGKINLKSKGIESPIGRDNIVYRAVSDFFLFTGIPFDGIDVSVAKTIPMESGLAGGSTDAAATLVGLDHMFNTNLPESSIISMGLQLGADVPFCIKGGTILTEGIGEIFTKLPVFPKSYFVVVRPNSGCSTAQIFKDYDTLGIINKTGIEKVVAGIVTYNLTEICKNMYNVLEKAVNLPEMSEIKETLTELGALGSSMTGSGSAVFGIFDNKSKAKKCAKILKDIYPFVFLCTPINHGPLIID